MWQGEAVGMDWPVVGREVQSWPQVQTRPSRTARLWPMPAATAETPERSETATGRWRSTVVPSPSTPRWLRPQAHGVPMTTGAVGSGAEVAEAVGVVVL